MMLLKGCGVEEKCGQKVLLQKKKKKKNARRLNNLFNTEGR